MTSEAMAAGLLHPGDPAIPAREACVFAELVARRAAEAPDQVVLRFEDGSQWTHAELLEKGRSTAAALREVGTAPGDRVLLWLPNGPEVVQALVATSLLGATAVPVATAYRGALLEHVLRMSGARTGIVHADLVPRLADVDRAELNSVVVARGGQDAAEVPGLATVGWEQAHRRAQPLVPCEVPHEPWDTFAILFTSGTTGPSKAVLTSYVQHYSFQTTVHWERIRPGDRVLVHAPMSHMTGVNAIYGAVLLGTSAAVVTGFDTRRFWETVEGTGATTCALIGSQVSFLVKSGAARPAGARLRRVLASPVSEDYLTFGRTYGVVMESGFAMTELPSALGTDPSVSALGSCGRVRPGMEVRLVDEHDIPVPDGQVGELVVRADRPWSITTGYLGDPEATAAAWRNGWFHTGDTLRRDAEGNFYFVDRLKDAIRRRGENISSAEVEAEVVAHPSVKAAAVVGVASEFAEQDVLAAVVPADGQQVDPRALLEHLLERLPYFMVPRYLRVLDELPMTATGRVQKASLREAGVTADTWDRESAGIVVRRERLA
jgi:crotonobetaine/carnitine-CoA ligase